MTRRNLPPLEVGTTYRAQDFEYLEFASQKFHREVTGEDTAILRLLLANATILEIPVSDSDLEHHMRLLMEAYPEKAIEHVKTRGWS